MKNFGLGFLSCLCLAVLLGTVAVGTRYSDPGTVEAEFTNAYLVLQARKHKVITSTQTLNLEPGEVVFLSTGSVSLVTKINGDFMAVQLSTITK